MSGYTPNAIHLNEGPDAPPLSGKPFTTSDLTPCALHVRVRT